MLWQRPMHKPKPYKCSICGAEVPNLPMPVLKHQLSHARPWLRATGHVDSRPEPNKVGDDTKKRREQP
jgi:hypothetical protein